jgi:hypothetical protein
MCITNITVISNKGFKKYTNVLGNEVKFNQIQCSMKIRKKGRVNMEDKNRNNEQEQQI